MTKPIVLLYHRVIDLLSDPQLLSLSELNFTKHMEVLSKKFNPVSFHEVLIKQEQGKLPDNSVIVTFDDGYADNFYNAKPILEKYGIPATFFISTGHIGKKCEFWWDELERLILKNKTLPELLNLDFNGFTFHWESLNDNQTGHVSIKNLNDWNVLKPEKRNNNQDLYIQLNHAIRPLNSYIRNKVMSHLRLWVGESDLGRMSHRIMTDEEIICLSKSSLFEIGAHTVSHPVLSELSIREQEVEISASKQDLEIKTGKRIKSFSYPYGNKNDYNSDTIAILKNNKFELAYSNFEGMISNELDVFQIPRHLVRNWNGDEFTLKLKSWFKD